MKHGPPSGGKTQRKEPSKRAFHLRLRPTSSLSFPFHSPSTTTTNITATLRIVDKNCRQPNITESRPSIRANMAQPDISSILAALGKSLRAHCRSLPLRVHATDLFIQLSRTRLLLRLRNRRRRANHRPPPTQAQSQRKPRAHLRLAHTFHSPLAVAASIFAEPNLRRAAQ